MIMIIHWVESSLWLHPGKLSQAFSHVSLQAKRSLQQWKVTLEEGEKEQKSEGRERRKERKARVDTESGIKQGPREQYSQPKKETEQFMLQSSSPVAKSLQVCLNRGRLDITTANKY